MIGVQSQCQRPSLADFSVAVFDRALLGGRALHWLSHWPGVPLGLAGLFLGSACV
jgi:hypothetical protein